MTLFDNNKKRIKEVFAEYGNSTNKDIQDLIKMNKWLFIPPKTLEDYSQSNKKLTVK